MLEHSVNVTYTTNSSIHSRQGVVVKVSVPDGATVGAAVEASSPVTYTVHKYI